MRSKYILLVLLATIVLSGLVMVTVFFVMSEVKSLSEDEAGYNRDGKNIAQNDGPAFIMNIGIDFEDFEFTNKKLTFDKLFMDYGFSIPANSNGPAKLNPQPTFILPMGTKVTSLVDGIVVGVSKLYSGDYSVMVAKNKSDDWIFETEHVINPTVKVGDKVRAGQVVAEVSGFDAHNYGGLGMVEIGILHGGAVPEHVCPFVYLDPTIKKEIESKILDFYLQWEKYKGDASIYDESSLVSPGCLTHERIEG